MEPSPQPLGPAKSVAFMGVPAARHARKTKNDSDIITLGVTAEQLLIFTNDEKADAKEMTKNLGVKDWDVPSKVCHQSQSDHWIWIAICGGTLF